ncbi:S-methyl-5-thioribose-1-phosphate isomerase [Borealophlyctis nickersoniae]|nr:S-methyl-5-thioribose-1-phosphate isomerase [Borealophlyctis nickersoniae]
MAIQRTTVLPFFAFFAAIAILSVIPIIGYFVWESQAAIPETDYADNNVTIGIADASQFPYSRVLFQSPAYTYSLFWNVTNVGTANETIDVMVVLSGPQDWNDPKALRRAWIGIGWGSTMLDAEMDVCHMDPKRWGTEGKWDWQGTTPPAGDLPVDVHEHFSQRKYAPPRQYEGPNPMITPVEGAYRGGQFVCRWRRATTPTDDWHKFIYPNQPTNMLWAFNPRPERNYKGDYFSYHENKYRGRLVATLTTGAVQWLPVAELSGKQAHGFGMAAIWLVLFPFSIFYARYLRSTFRWITVHITIQTVGTIGIIAFLAVIILNRGEFVSDRPHPLLGITIIGLVGLQVLMGVLNAFGLWYERFHRNRKYVQKVHYALGASLLIMAAIQCGLGLDTLYPWVEPRYPGLWVAYFSVLTGWIAAFIGAELWFWRRVYRKDPGVNADKVVKENIVRHIGEIKFKSADGDRGAPVAQESERTLNEASGGLLAPKLRNFSWESLNHAIVDGELLVVANRRYVYDISQWIKSHPGGQIILLTVAGTDITNDYFHEAGFDAEEFTPRPPVPAQRGDRSQALSRGPNADHPPVQPAPGEHAYLEVYPAETTEITLTDDDWKKILRARRTNVHTRLAIQKLSQLLIGEILPVAGSSGPPPYDPTEYRRYTMTNKTSLTPPQSRTPTYSLRFAALYPHTSATTPAPPILPGQCIELQARIDGELVSRYYTPVRGSTMTCFEIDVKATLNGKMSKWLVKQRPADRQVKIRGPFGAPIVGPGREISGLGPLIHSHTGGRGPGVPEEIMFVAAGSGISPFLQILKHLTLPIGVPLTVVADFVPSLADEMQLYPGDAVVTDYHYNDGWAIGHTLTAPARQGMFPLPVTIPPYSPPTPTPFHITLINCVHSLDDITESELLHGVESAYPGLLTVHHFISSSSTASSHPPGHQVPGLVHPGGLTPEALASVAGISETVWGEEGPAGLKKCVYVCGPERFNGFVVDLFVEAGATAAEVRVLPADRWVGAEAFGGWTA